MIPNKPLDCVYPICIFVNICFIYISFRTEIDQTLQLLQVVMEYPSKIRMDRQTFTSGQGILQQNKDGQNNYFIIFTIGQGILQQNEDGQTNFLQLFPVVWEYHFKIRMDKRQTFHNLSGNINKILLDG